MSDMTLQEFLDLAWSRIVRGVRDKHSPARHPVLATIAPDGRPEARTVVLRAADRAAATLEMHTDSASPKVAALAANSRAEIHVWDPGQRLQIRLAGRVRILTGDDVAERWARIPGAARRSYGSRPAPGSAIAGPFDYATPGDPARLAVLICHVDRADLLLLGPVHQRAEYHPRDDWAGTWIAP